MSDPLHETDVSVARPALQQRVAQVILDAAARVLARSLDATMADVASAAGVARATLYRYFPSRGELLDSVAVVAVGDATTRLAASRIHEVPADEGIVRSVRALVDTGDSLVVLAQHGSGRRRGDLDRGILRPLRELLERAQADGVLRTEIPSAWLAESLVAVVISFVLSSATLGQEDTIAAITTLFLDGARKRPSAVA